MCRRKKPSLAPTTGGSTLWQSPSRTFFPPEGAGQGAVADLKQRICMLPSSGVSLLPPRGSASRYINKTTKLLTNYCYILILLCILNSGWQLKNHSRGASQLNSTHSARVKPNAMLDKRQSFLRNTGRRNDHTTPATFRLGFSLYLFFIFIIILIKQGPSFYFGYCAGPAAVAVLRATLSSCSSGS